MLCFCTMFHSNSSPSKFDINNTVKVDIEGQEYKVLPNLVGHGVICFFNVMLVEYHQTHLAAMNANSFPYKKPFDLNTFVYYVATYIPNCNLRIYKFDDETYNNDPDHVPLPAPVVDVNSLPMPLRHVVNAVHN